MRLLYRSGFMVSLLISVQVFSFGGQDTPNQSIMIGEFKITLGLKRDDLFKRLGSQYTMHDVTPATDVAVTPGYKLYLIRLKTADRFGIDAPVGEFAFQDGVLVLAVRFWMTANSDVPNALRILGEAMRSLTENGIDACTVKTVFPPGTSTKGMVICGKKSLDIYDFQIEETLSQERSR